MDFVSFNLDDVIQLIAEYGFKAIVSIVVVLVGFRIIDAICNYSHDLLINKKIETSIVKFSDSLVKVSLKGILIYTLLTNLGAQLTSFVAIFGAASFAIGMALQGSLSNFAAGVLILLLRPFRVGDYVEVNGMSGIVSSIQVFSTILKTHENKTVILPNGPIIASNIINYSDEDKIRVDVVFGVDYKTDLKLAKRVMKEETENHELILNDPSVFVGIGELGDSSINITVRFWVKPEDSWGIHFDVIERVKDRFDKENIEIPYPHIQLLKS